MNGTPPKSKTSFCFPCAKPVSPAISPRAVPGAVPVSSTNPVSPNPAPANPAPANPAPANPAPANPVRPASRVQSPNVSQTGSIQPALSQGSPSGMLAKLNFTLRSLGSPLKKESDTDLFEKISAALTPQNVAAAYDCDRRFVGTENQNHIKSILNILSNSYTTPFLLVINHQVLFLLEESDQKKQFRLVDIDKIPATLTLDSLFKLGKKLDEGTVDKIKFKLTDIQALHSIQFDDFSVDLHVYPSQSTISSKNQKMVVLFSRNQESSFDMFSTDMKHELSNLTDLNYSSFVVKDQTTIFTLNFKKSKGINPFLNKVFSTMKDVVDRYAGIKLENTQLFSNTFYQILNLENKPSKEALFSSIDSDHFQDYGNSEKLSSRLQDGSYPYCIYLETPSVDLVENINSAMSTPQGFLKDSKLYLHASGSTVILLKNQHLSGITSLLEEISKDALTHEYSYSMYLGNPHS